ncbi:MAG TPA: hypothetical protein DCX17_01910 [Firmicutes bacterium]|jgi:LacI family transcriptional regulator|nr:hypothetical protein [Bacillota bacterium]
MKKNPNHEYGKRPTLKDISLKAGITITSVSRALKGCSNISPATQERVRNIAMELGYISNPHAQSLRNGHFPVIAIVYDNFKNPFYSIVTGMIDALIREHNYRSMVFYEFNQDIRLGVNAAKEISAFNLSGVISFLVPTQEAIDLFKLHNIPLIIIGRDGAPLYIASVSSNDIQGGYLAGKHLFNTGARKMAYIGAGSNLPINQNRLDGFMKALNEQGLAPLIYLNDENIPTEAVLDKALKDQPDLNGIFCFNDLMAFEVINRLMELNYQIPKDVAVIGYDNLQRYINYPFRLTTIDADMQKTAALVVSSIFEQLQTHSNVPNNQIVNVDLIVGKTTKKI